ncbi:MAG: magnesium/cobalt transporter CorA [Candidatus Micrarchaeia archaeon]|jgi:magnesium transporter
MIRGFVCDKKKCELTHERDLDRIVKYYKDPRVNIWIEVEAPTPAELKLLETRFGFHHLTVEDILHGNQRPKIDDYHSYSFITVRVPSEKARDGSTQFNVYLGHNFLVTVNMIPVPSEQIAIDRCAKNPQLLLRGADFVLYTILDSFVDSMFPEINKLNDRVDRMEDRIFTEQQSTEVLEAVFRLKHDAVRYRRIIWPLRDVLNVLSRRDSRYVSERNIAYFRDIYDHLIRLSESIDAIRDIISSAMEAYLSVVSNNLSGIMKKLAAITAIIMVPSLVAGIYGMNFQHMPELDSPMGYYFALGIMATSAITLAIYFRKRQWL